MTDIIIKETPPPGNSPSRSGVTHNESVKIRDVGGATDANPNPQARFVDPNPGGMLGPDWQNASN